MRASELTYLIDRVPADIEVVIQGKDHSFNKIWFLPKMEDVIIAPDGTILEYLGEVPEGHKLVKVLVVR